MKVRGNPDKLIPQNKRTKRERSEIARKGGIASGASRREAADLRKLMNMLLEKPVDELKNILSDETAAAFSGMRVDMAACMKQVAKALEGDTKSFEMVRDTSGQKPVDKTENKTEQSGTVTFHWARTEREA